MSRANDILMKDSTVNPNSNRAGVHRDCDDSSLSKDRVTITKALDVDRQKVNQKKNQTSRISGNLLTAVDQDMHRNQNQGNSSKMILLPNRRKKQYISHDNNFNRTNESHSRMMTIERQKESLVKQLRQLNESIAEVNGEAQRQIRQKILMEDIALKKAKQTIQKFKHRKIKQQKRKRQMLQVSLNLLRQQNQISKKEREVHFSKRKQEKIKDIQERLVLQRQKREKRQLIQKESNRLIAKLKKQEDIVKKQGYFSIQDLQVHKSSDQTKRVLNIKEIEQHERQYLKRKGQQQRRTITVSHPIRKYDKNIWACKLEQEAQIQNQVTKQKQQQKKQLLERKLKYSQIVKSMYSPVRFKTSNCQSSTPKGNNQSRKFLTKSGINSRRMSEGRSIGATVKKRNKETGKQGVSLQQQQEQKRRILSREYQLRRETEQRLIKFENRSVYWMTAAQSNQRPNPKYHNYLGSMKKRTKSNIESMYKLFENPRISREQKYNKIIKMAATMENKAKLIEEVLHQGDQKTTNLYLGSIQAKIALLQQL